MTAALQTPTAFSVPKAGAAGTIDSGWLDLAVLSNTFVTLGTTQVVTGAKSFTAAVSVIDGNFDIVGSSDSTKVARFEVDGLTTATVRTFTLPDASGTIPLLSTTNAFSGANSFIDGIFSILGSVNATKIAKFEVDGFTTATTRTFTLPDASTTLAGLSVANTFTANQAITGQLTTTGQCGFGGATNAQAVITIGSTNPLSGVVQTALLTNVTGTSAATTAIRGFQTGIGTAAAAYTCADVVNILAGAVTQGAGSTITRATGVWAVDPNSGTNKACVVLGGFSLSYTGNWALFSASTDASRFSGRVEITDTTNSTGPGTGSLRLSGGMDIADGKNIGFATGTGTIIGTATTQKLGFWAATPVAQPSGAAQAAVATTAATNITPYGFTTAAQADGIITLLNEVRRVLVLEGLMKGSA